MTGIEAYAIHLPRFTILAEEYRRATGRAPAKLEAKRIHGYDEDAATLAIEAARKVLALGGHAPGTVIGASERGPPFAGLVAEALGLLAARVADERGPASGLSALLAARDATAQGNEAVLVVSADAPDFAAGDEREAMAGSAASAWLVASKGPAQLRRAAHGIDAASALDHLTRAGLRADSVSHAATADLDAPSMQALQRGMPKARLATPAGRIGHAGATAPLLGLGEAIEQARPGETIVALAAGGRSSLALSMEAERAPLASSLTAALAAPHQMLDHGALVRLRGWLSPPSRDVSQGAAVSVAQWQETLPSRLRWEGQRCACGRAQFPPRLACMACGSRQLTPFRLSGKGRVHSRATIGAGSAPAEFAEQQRRMGAYDVAIVELAEGPRVAAQVAGADPGSAKIGDAVELVVRRLYVQEGAPRYGFKARLT